MEQVNVFAKQVLSRKSYTPVAGQIVILPEWLNLIRCGSLFALHGMHPDLVRPWRGRSLKRCFPIFSRKSRRRLDF